MRCSSSTTGTEFSGSQSQRGQRTVQDTLEDATAAYCGEPIEGSRRRIALAGRTDAGVHARAQLAVIDCPRHDSLDTVRDALNHYLPGDVAVRAVCEVAADFDPRRDAVARRYCYRIRDGGMRSPLRRRDVWQRRGDLDASAMAAAAAALPRGRRDWAAFAGVPDAGVSTIRTLISMGVRRRGPHEIEVSMEADAFLPHQVRRTVGALERVGGGRADAAGVRRTHRCARVQRRTGGAAAGTDARGRPLPGGCGRLGAGRRRGAGNGGLR